MFTKQLLAVVASVSATTAAAIVQTSTKFDAGANTNMAVYWGQGPNQPRLAHFCADSNIDIIPIAFLNIFPDQVGGGYPGTNFGNQCGPETFKNKDGSDSPLLSNCPMIGPDIKTCQAMGKKILLSLGGAIPDNQSINDDASAVAFAKFLWNAFGPEDAKYDGPRPFGDAVVDGFDFDIESAVSPNDAASQYRGYGTMIDALRVLFAANTKKEYYISGSPQCVIPDAHLAHPIETSWFDFLFIQFYNTPQCSARAYFDASYGRKNDGDKPSSISFDTWVGFVRTTAMNKDVKLYIGLPAAPLTALAYDTKMYIAPDDVINLIDLFQCRYPKEFGGIMVFEATYSEQNLIDNKPFVDVIKAQLANNKCADKSTISSTSTPSSTSFSVASTKVTSPTLTSTSSSRIQNSTFTAGPTVPIGTGSSSIPTYNTTGIWNGTSSSTTLVGTGSSSIPPYTTHTGIWNGTSSSITLVGTGSSSIPPYTTHTGIWNGTASSVSSGTGYTSSSIPVNSSTSTRDYASTTTSLHPTGASSGFSSTVSSTSVPYPVSNSTSSSTTSVSGGLTSTKTTSEGIIYTTETITVTKCPPAVTSCPARTSITVYPITSSSIVPVTSVPSNSPETTSSVTSHEAVTTVIVTSFVTTCPVTNTITHGGSTSIQTTFTVSTVTSTITSVISSTASPAPSGSVPITSAPVNSPETTSFKPSHGGITTVICPVTNTITNGGSTSIQTTFTLSTVTSTITSVITSTATPVHVSTTPNAPETSSAPLVPVPSVPSVPSSGHGASSPPKSSPSGSQSSPVGSGSHPASPPEQSAHGSPSTPAHGGSSSQGSHPNSPVDTGNSPGASNGGSSNPPSTGNTNTNTNNNSPVQGSGNNNNNNNNNSPSPPPGSLPVSSEGLTTTRDTSTQIITATIPGSSHPGQTTPSLPEIVTQTLVPIPVNPEQTAHPAASGSPSGNNGGNAGGFSTLAQASPLPSPTANTVPFPVAGNGTTTATVVGGGGAPSGSFVSAPGASGTGAFSPAGGVVPFTGSASSNKVASGVSSVVAVIVAAAMVLM
ncbi:MAG: hypothetical protein Q9186_000916 [Xanthomendoza sp. 1 TL-2023]